MRVLILCTRFPYPATDGITVPIFELVRRMGPRHDLALAAFALDGKLAADRRAVMEPFLDETVVLPFAGTVSRTKPSVWAKALWGVPFSVLPFTSRQGAEMVKELLSKQDFDVVLCQLVHTAQVLPARLHLPACILVQDVVHHAIRLNVRYESIPKRAYSRLNAMLMKTYERQEYARFTRCAVVSETERARLRELIPSMDAKVIPNGVDAERFRPSNLASKRDSIIYLGALSGSRNEDAAWTLATEIFPPLQERFPQLRLEIVGKHPSRRLLDLAARNPKVSVTGEVDDVRNFLDGARAFVSPQKVGTGIKNSVLEAMAMSLPVIASPGSLEGIDGMDGRHYKVCDSVQQFVDACTRLIEDESWGRALGTQARALVMQRYTWDTYCTLVEEMLQEAVGVGGIRS